jgi:DNA-binding transcriptional LysR family regulator
VEFGTTILINHIKNFLDSNPDIHLDFLFSHNLLDPLQRDDVDLIIDCKLHQVPNFERIYLFREQYITIASPEFIKIHNIDSIHDLAGVNILSMDKDLEWWRNFLSAIPEDQQASLKNVVQINHIRGLINGAIAGLGIGFVPKYTVLRELKEKILIDPFPRLKPAADDFSIYIKKEKLAFKKNQLLIDYLTRLEPSEFGAD